MRFGPVRLADAHGAVLAHTRRLQGRVLRKGSILDADALEALAAEGVAEVIAARLDPFDVPEDAAAERLAAALLSPGIGADRASTGRVNLRALAAGLLTVDAAKIDRVNAVDESLTVAAAADGQVAAPRDMLATIKVIPFAVPAAVLSAAELLAREGAPAFALHPFRPLVAGLAVTELPGLKESAVAGAIQATADRVAGLTGSMLPAIRCPHAEAPIAAALASLIGQGAELLMIAGASAVVDRRDVAPAAIVAAGGEILHFGMPVDPGNLICIGRIGARPALVLPGCARSPTLNGIDFVLARLFAGLPCGAAEVSRMGAGGLLKEPRPLPRATAGKGGARRSVAAVVLAAGRSTRMAPRNKLLVADASGRAMVARVVDNVLASLARPVLVVTGHDAGAVERALAGRPVRFVHAARYAEGLAESLKAGIAAIPEDVSAALVCLGDMPLVAGPLLDRLIAAYDDEGRSIVAPAFGGLPGNPVLWDRRHFAEIMSLTGDAGARSLLSRHREQVAEIEMGDDAVLRDFDTPESLATIA
jgi:molybdenum cofactor cytidylyltransferase